MDALKFSVFDIETIPNQSLPEDLRPRPDMTKVKYGNTKNAFDRQRIEAEFIADFESKLDKTMSLDPYLCQVCVLVLYDSWTDTCYDIPAVTEAEETDMLRAFWDRIKTRYHQDIPIVGFNSSSFDFTVQITRSILADISVDPVMLRSMTDRQDLRNFRHIDLMQRLGYRNPFSGQLQVHSLDWNCRRFGISGKQEGMDGSKVYSLFKEGKISEIVEYCRQDVLATAKLFERVAPWIYQPPLKTISSNVQEK